MEYVQQEHRLDVPVFQVNQGNVVSSWHFIRCLASNIIVDSILCVHTTEPRAGNNSIQQFGGICTI